MLGVRREDAEAAGKLQDAGLIRYAEAGSPCSIAPRSGGAVL
jgi:hypothetical protein